MLNAGLKKVWIVLVWCVSSLLLAQSFAESNTTFRKEIIALIKASSKNQLAPQEPFLTRISQEWQNNYFKTAWSVTLMLYCSGRLEGQGHAQGDNIITVIQKATQQTLARVSATQNLSACRFKVMFDYYPAQLYSFVQYQDAGLEVIGNILPLRQLNVSLIQEQIKSSTDYLLRNLQGPIYGMPKFYDPRHHKPEPVLRTIYTASTLFTFLQLLAQEKNPALEKRLQPAAAFLLSQQALKGPAAGSFDFGFDTQTQKKIEYYLVGTTSKTIFTLLLLQDYFKNNPAYGQAAQKAGQWLVKMVQKDGKVISGIKIAGSKVVANAKFSLLYSGQTLSALSRLYKKYPNPAFYQAASRIANNFARLVAKQGPFLGDEYRVANSVSTSWVMLGLIDYAQINPSPMYKNLIQRLGKRLLQQQNQNPNDLYNYGRFLDLISTSGSGWINEVFGIYYPWCKKERLEHCENYKQAKILISRWLIQNAYTPQNTYAIPHPAIIMGGFRFSFDNPKVRTDAVCHGINGLLSLMRILGDKKNSVLLTIPERPLPEILPSLKAGKGFREVKPFLCQKGFVKSVQ